MDPQIQSKTIPARRAADAMLRAGISFDQIAADHGAPYAERLKSRIETDGILGSLDVAIVATSCSITFAALLGLPEETRPGQLDGGLSNHTVGGGQ